LYFDCGLKDKRLRFGGIGLQPKLTLPKCGARNHRTKVQYGCEVDCEVRDEPLTGELASQQLSRKNFKLVQGADAGGKKRFG
jgi:hypothetical protein